MIGNLDTKVILKGQGAQVDDGAGGVANAAFVTKRTFWANIEEEGSTKELREGQNVLSKTFRIEARNSNTKAVNGDLVEFTLNGSSYSATVTGSRSLDTKKRFIEITAEVRNG